MIIENIENEEDIIKKYKYHALQLKYSFIFLFSMTGLAFLGLHFNFFKSDWSFRVASALVGIVFLISYFKADFGMQVNTFIKKEQLSDLIAASKRNTVIQTELQRFFKKRTQMTDYELFLFKEYLNKSKKIENK